ncbi:MAG TPA: hypothetical protein VMU69_33360 [Bradyrhizobium sp.]|nr:hypothetical protein [Bradyrhizobium sp.]
MFQRMIDNFRDSVASAMRLTSLAALAALALLIAAAFLCAAAFIFILQKYGPVEACLAGAALFFVITLIMAFIYIIRKNQIRARAAAAAKAAAAQSPLADPMLAALALQVIRAVGVKKVIPLLAVGGLALGLMAGRSTRASRDDAAK